MDFFAKTKREKCKKMVRATNWIINIIVSLWTKTEWIVKQKPDYGLAQRSRKESENPYVISRSEEGLEIASMVEAIKDPKARGSKIIVLNSAKSLAGVLLRFGCESDWHAEADARMEFPCYISARKDLIREPERQAGVRGAG